MNIFKDTSIVSQKECDIKNKNDFERGVILVVNCESDQVEIILTESELEEASNIFNYDEERDRLWELLERLENIVNNFERIQNPVSCVPDCCFSYPNCPGPSWWCTLPYIGGAL